MQSLPLHFRLLLANIEPSQERKDLAAALPGDLRDWLKEHELETEWPHTRLGGSYMRSTATLDIHDVDTFLFRPASDLDRTPNAVVLELKNVLEDYPGAIVEVRPQRRSVRLHFVDHDLSLDIVPCVAEDGYPGPLQIPDRPQQEWIVSLPFEYMDRLSRLNKDHNGKVKRLIKLVKAWRDVQMINNRPRSYVLEIMIVQLVEDGTLVLDGRSWPQILEDLFVHWHDEYGDLLEQEDALPQIEDQHLDTESSTPWERRSFETFIRRVEKAKKIALRANCQEDDESAAEEWAKLFGEHWPEDDDVKAEARREAAAHQTGVARIGRAGRVVGCAAPVVTSRPTRFHGGRRFPAPIRIPRTDRPLEQLEPMARTFPGFHARPNAVGGVTWRGTLQPTPESPKYSVRVIHNAQGPPRVYVDSHWLDPRCRHLYEGGALCLYWPKQWWWTAGESLPETIIAWSALWLYFYELWLVTGEWLAPSSPHGVGAAGR